MKCLLPPDVNVYFDAALSDECTRYALSELCRLLQAMKLRTASCPVKGFGCRFSLGEKVKAPLAGILCDGWSQVVSRRGIALGAKEPKGLLNAVYDVAEQMGVLFLEPGSGGEWIPDPPCPLTGGKSLHNPRFPWRGTCFQKIDEPVQEWMIFHAKMKFNGAFIADQCNFEAAAQIAGKLGLRLELGQHGFRQLLPREMFSKHPERFRMVQPEDFSGTRRDDYNCCITHPATQKIIAESFQKKLRTLPHAYGLHCWPDDLPGSGWCMCSSCRSMTPTDQSMKAMNLLGEAAREVSPGTKVAFLAYHDTMFPGAMIHPTDRTFLVFAPRERCYAHALDDPSCARNRHYMRALEQWEKYFSGIPDNHTFEYYFDQILFRGLYFFLPRIILEDMKVYERHGIESHFALQVVSVSCAPAYNLSVFSQGLWNGKCKASDAIDFIARRILPSDPAPFRRYLAARAAAFERAAEMCGHDLGIYLDYRWLPESSAPFGKRSAGNFRAASRKLQGAADALKAAAETMPERVRELVHRETRRAEFEAAELAGMAIQQEALNALAKYHDTGKEMHRKNAVTFFQDAVKQFQISRKKAEILGIPPENWYFRNINDWQRKELTAKAERYAAER